MQDYLADRESRPEGSRAVLADGLGVHEAAARVRVGKTALYEALTGFGAAPP
ncbi:hypothetical protein [Methylobacterium radiotolerans]|uniref:hypothetical protein n=1 Tax=Methylobacterium radiotolerans TaxID=31998 RepID=UPI0011921873|nr:hypothetical protein MRA01_64530 [Methylobacterium radiotolerans]